MHLDILQFRQLGDSKGYLTPLEFERNVPFPVRRVYYIYGTATNCRRGFHAHHKLRQLAICLQGSCRFLMDDGREKKLITLASRTEGLLIEPLVWHEMDEFSADCLLLVLASDYYEESDYIRDYATFAKFCAGLPGSH